MVMIKIHELFEEYIKIIIIKKELKLTARLILLREEQCNTHEEIYDYRGHHD